VALVVIALAIGVAVGRLLQPLRYRHLGAPRVRWPAALGLGVAVAVLADRLDGDAAVTAGIAGQALLVAGVLANLHLVGAGVLAVGLGLNLVSMAVDGGVPVRPGALVEAGVLEPDEVPDATVSGPRHIEGDGDALGWLGDALPVAPLGIVVSFGDLVVAVGVADVAAHAARPRRRRPADRHAHAGADRHPDGPLPVAGPVGAELDEPVDEPLFADDEPVLLVDDDPPLFEDQPLAITSARPVQDWGTAPPASPVSGTHHSARPDVMAPLVVGPATVEIPARQSR
jgi:hypothetical protein